MFVDGRKSDEWMLNVAREMNCSETAFLLNKEEGSHLRWFSPKAEVGLCGHVALASAHVLWERNYSQECGNFVFHQGRFINGSI